MVASVRGASRLRYHEEYISVANGYGTVYPPHPTEHTYEMKVPLVGGRAGLKGCLQASSKPGNHDMTGWGLQGGIFLHASREGADSLYRCRSLENEPPR